jgi:hypothetical protein
MATKKRLVKFPGSPYHAYYGLPWYWGYGDNNINNVDFNLDNPNQGQGTDYPTGDVGLNGGGFDGGYGGFDGGDCGGDC